MIFVFFQFTIVLGLTVLSLANFGNTFEFSGLDPSFHSKGQFKPTVKPFTAFTNPVILSYLTNILINCKILITVLILFDSPKQNRCLV